MASISRDKNGNRTIQLVCGDSKRRSIRLGKVPKKVAEEIKTKVEALNVAIMSNTPPDRATAEWVGGLESALCDKLVAVGLVQKRHVAGRLSLASFLDCYISNRSDVAVGTANVYRHTRRCLIEFFGVNRLLGEITAVDADNWRRWLIQSQPSGQALAENTARRRCGVARQFFRAAVRGRLIGENPFADMKGISVRSNRSRDYFVTREDAAKVLDACPDTQWRLLFALSRYGGLRCPSEHLALRWGDVNWEHGRVTIGSPKTAHHEGKEARVIPLFPELRPYLEEAWDEAEPGAEHVITQYRDSNQNLRTQLQRIIHKAGLTPWPKLFQNLRSTRETELAGYKPMHVVCAWMGNSQRIAAKHYLQVTEQDYESAAFEPTGTVQNPVQSAAATGSTDSSAETPIAAFIASYDALHACTEVQLSPAGFEPTTYGLKVRWILRRMAMKTRFLHSG